MKVRGMDGRTRARARTDVKAERTLDGKCARRERGVGGTRAR
jgi:hypothetical protein